MDRLKPPPGALSLLLLGLACAGCPSATKEPPPPPESLEIASAAPRALGALAGGTEAAPTVGSLRRAQPESNDPFGLGESPPLVPETEDDEGEPDAGAAPGDAGAPKRPIEEVPL